MLYKKSPPPLMHRLTVYLEHKTVKVPLQFELELVTVLYFGLVKSGNAQLLSKRAITWSVIKMTFTGAFFTLCIVTWENTITFNLLKLYNCTDMISLPADLIGSSFYLTHLTWGCLDTGEQANIWMHWSECQWTNAS